MSRIVVSRKLPSPNRVRCTALGLKEGQGFALDKLGPSRHGVLCTTAPDPNFLCSEIGIGCATADQIRRSAGAVQMTPAAQR
jgi:hypothetical protein